MKIWPVKVMQAPVVSAAVRSKAMVLLFVYSLFTDAAIVCVFVR